IAERYMVTRPCFCWKRRACTLKAGGVWTKASLTVSTTQETIPLLFLPMALSLPAGRQAWRRGEPVPPGLGCAGASRPQGLGPRLLAERWRDWRQQPRSPKLLRSVLLLSIVWASH